MTKFYCIVTDVENLANPDTFRLLKAAVEEKGLDFEVIDVKTQSRTITSIEPGILYRLGITNDAVMLEARLVNDSMVTFYKNKDNLFARGFEWGSTLRLQMAGLPIIPTVFAIAKLDKPTLQVAVDELGGFPIVVKGAGGSHGSAVKSANSVDEISEIIANDDNKKTLVLRRFIHEARHIRIVVVGDQAVDAIEYQPQPDDFRTNAVAVPQVKAFDLESNLGIKQTAEAAVKTIGLEFGGVDILLQPDGQFFIAEVNFPCNFARNQMNTGTNVAGAMVEYLVKKSEG